MKKILALLLSVLMLAGLLVGCSNEPATPADGDAPAATDTPGATGGDQSDADDYAAQVATGHLGTITYSGYEVPNFPLSDAIMGSGALKLPLVEEPTTLSIFYQFSSTKLGSPAELLCYQVFEENTGVSIDWQTYTEPDQFSIFIASGLYTDLVFCSKTTYTGGIDKAIEEEIFVPANNYFDYMPNFTALLAADRSIDIQSKTDAGNYFMSCIQTGNEPAWCGPMIRTDWLEDCGLDTPLTYDDWYEALVAFRDQKGSTGMFAYPDGQNNYAFSLTSGYDTAATFYAKDGVEARYGFLDENMYDYVAMMAKWYKEGLINKDFISLNAWSSGNELYASEQCGVFEFCSYTFKSTFEALLPGDEDRIDAVPLPARTADQQGNLHFRRYNFLIGDSCSFITTGAVERGLDVLAAQWSDYQYSFDGFCIKNYGRPGLSYEIGEDGYPHFTDFVMKPSGEYADWQITEVRDICQSKGAGGFYSWLQAYDLYPPEVVAAYSIWDGSATGDWVMPGITMTTEESEEYTAVFGDIQTYVGEMVLRFITGEVELNESAWADFVGEIETMGIQKAIDVYQAALDRYNNR